MFVYNENVDLFLWCLILEENWFVDEFRMLFVFGGKMCKLS